MPWPDRELVTEELSESRTNEEGNERKKGKKWQSRFSFLKLTWVVPKASVFNVAPLCIKNTKQDAHSELSRWSA